MRRVAALRLLILNSRVASVDGHFGEDVGNEDDDPWSFEVWGFAGFWCWE